jgi:hypothetical protein
MKWRGLFRVHLSTAVVILLVSVWFIWLNIIEHGEYIRPNADSNYYTSEFHYGFPMVFARRWPFLAPYQAWDTNAILINIAIGFTVVGFAGIVTEFLIRRRETKEFGNSRVRFQLHLSTVVVLMFVSGLLVGINIYLWQHPVNTNGLHEHAAQITQTLSPFNRLIAFLLSLACIFTCWAICEYFIRRREAQQKS